MSKSHLFVGERGPALGKPTCKETPIDCERVRISPSKHSVLTINTVDGQLPILFVELDGQGQLLKEQAAFARAQQSAGKEYQHIADTAKAIGRFWDWVTFSETDTLVNAQTLPQILTRFINARYSGTADINGFDKFGLNWKPVKRTTVDKDLRKISAFSDFISTELGYAPLNPKSPLPMHSVGEQSFPRAFNRLATDMFIHLARSRRQKSTRQVTTKRKGSNNSQRGQGSFPLDRIHDLIKTENSISKKMIYIELACGGVRMSEPLHHFVTDVLPGQYRPHFFPNDKPTHLPLVILADPCLSKYTDSLEVNSYDRRQYLHKKYGLIPRSNIKKGSLRSGWKGMLYDNDVLKISQLYWSDDALAGTFSQLFQQLMQLRDLVPRKIRDSHPYLYFVDNPKRREFGRPITIGNLEKSFSRACKRIGLNPYKNKVSPHGLRHSYKKQLEKLNLSPSLIQVIMHHKSIVSQELYGLPTSDEINKTLSDHYKKS